MIIVMRKSNIVLVLLIFVLSLAVYSLSIGEDSVSAVSKGQEIQWTVLLDPGHGGEDPGAVSDYSGIKEKDFNLNIAFKLKEQLENSSYKVMMTRTEDRLEYNSETRNIVQKRREDLTRRKKMMDEGGADIVVSLHLNKFPQTQSHGVQVFYPPNSPESQKLAFAIQKSVRESFDPSNTREALVKKESIIILDNLKTTTVIVECGFLSNPDEEKRIRTDEYATNLAAAIKAGIDKYFRDKQR